MRHIKYFVLTVSVILFSLVACQDEFLDVAPTTSLSSTELSSAAGLEGTLIGAYSILLGRGGFYTDASNWFWGSVLGGDANKGTNAGDQSQVNEIQTYAAQTNNGSIFEKYGRCYEGIARTNATLRLVGVATEAGQVGEATLTRISAEARFLRGHYYFDLKRNFDNVPFVDETWDEVTPVGNKEDIWPFIEADFQFAFDNLPETQGEAGRAN
ncbi:MAG: RagB/SusD family nutrient uptake outer membrane protein, partial [Bacteroidota bacterium]